MNDPTAWADGVAQIVREYLEDQVGELRAQQTTVCTSLAALEREVKQSADKAQDLRSLALSGGVMDRLEQRLAKLEEFDPFARLAETIERGLGNA